MKTKLLKIALCAMATLPMGAWAEEAEEAKVSTTKTWTFEDYAVSETPTTNITEVTMGGSASGLYNRSATSGRGFKWQTSDVTSVTFSDGFYIPSVSIMATKGNAAYNKDNLIYLTAAKTTATISGTETDVKNYMTAFFAFNTTVAGTCYAYVKSTAEAATRIYWSKGDGTTSTTYTKSSVVGFEEIKLTAEAGAFFIGGVTSTAGASTIYAIRFVPTSEKKDEWVYIG